MEMLEIILLLLMGHFLGDFFFQNDAMALHKKDKKTDLKSWLPLIVHCAIYSVTVYLCLLPALLSLNWKFHPLTFIFILGSHIILDGTKIIEIFYNMTGGRSWFNALKRLNPDIKVSEINDFMKQKITLTPEQLIYIPFTALVQVVSDNFLHLLMMIGYCYLIF